MTTTTQPRSTATDGLSDLTAARSTKGVVVITGGTAGLGRATAREFADAGYDVAVLARGLDGLRGTVADLAGRGVRALGVQTDVAQQDQVDAAAEQVTGSLGPVTVWVNNAMASVFAPFQEADAADFERATAVTYFGAVNGTRAALRTMVPRDQGVIVQVGSALAARGIPLQAAYCGAKHALVGFTESTIVELEHDGSAVRVVMVHMPALNTPQFDWVRHTLPKHPQPVAPIYRPEVGARAVRRAAEHPKRSTWVGLPTAYTTLGNRLVAPLLDAYLARSGVSGQQSDTVTKPMAGDNLYEPVPGDHGAEGSFSDEAQGSTYDLLLALPRQAVADASTLARSAVGLGRRLLKA